MKQSSLEERAEQRRKNITIKKVNLHSKEHHSFHIGLPLKEAWELLARMSKEAYFEEFGVMPLNRVDKTVVRKIKLHERI